MKQKRKKIWIHRFQTYLSFRIALSFLLCQCVLMAVFTFGWSIVVELAEFLHQDTRVSFSCIALVTVSLLAFCLVIDAVKWTHRVVGPLYRFQRTIKDITAGEEVELVRLRADDFLQEMKEEFNEMLKALEQRGAISVKASIARQEAKAQASS